MAIRKPYSIRVPPFDLLSGGIRVMYGLFGWLLAKGEVVFLNHTFDTDFIGIYPEIYHGNDLGATTVVRYLLNRPGFMSSYGIPGPAKFDKTDKIYGFTKLYTPKLDDDHLMFLPILNLNLFRDYGKKRTKRCVFVGKGVDLDKSETKGLPRITRELASDQAKLADFLNECEVMYSYENPTAMNEIARLCGCKVVFFPDGCLTTYTKEELETRYEPTMYGIGWNKEPKFNPNLFRTIYTDLIDKFSKSLDRFIEDTQND